MGVSAARRRIFGLFGPGFVAGSANNDPTTVASLAVVGASTGYSLAWVVVLILPMLAVIQSIAAVVGTVCGTGLQAALRRRYGRGLAAWSLAAIVPVSALTLAADIRAGAEALHLLSGVATAWFIVPFAVGTGLLLFTSRYAAIERALAFATLGFLAYVASTVLAHPDWSAIARAVVLPAFVPDAAHVAGMVALLGTTLTSYVYVWESIEVSQRREPVRRLRNVQRDAVAGLLLSAVSFFFILVGTGATVGVAQHPVETAADAALALVPLAGRYAPLVFGAGLLASAVIAVPVIVASIGYVVGETFGWRCGLDERVRDARAFYGALAVAILAGTVLAFADSSAIGLLVAASIVGGIATPPSLVMLIVLARDRKAMGDYRIGAPLAVGGACVAAVVTACDLAYLGMSAASFARS